MFPLLLFLAVPAAEFYLFVEVGGQIGAWATVGMIFATAIIGGTILRHQGQKTIARAREQITKQKLPVTEFANGAVLVLAAFLLLTPGFITDALGALLLIPFFRRLILTMIFVAIRSRVHKFKAHAGASRHGHSGTVVDGEFEDISDANPSSAPPVDQRQIDKD